MKLVEHFFGQEVLRSAGFVSSGLDLKRPVSHIFKFLKLTTESAACSW